MLLFFTMEGLLDVALGGDIWLVGFHQKFSSHLQGNPSGLGGSHSLDSAGRTVKVCK